MLVIGPLWLLTRDLFDGASIDLAYTLHNPDGLYFLLANANWLLAVWFFKLCFAVSEALGVHYLFVAKLLVSLMLLGLYADFVALARRLLGCVGDEAKLVGLLCLASPALYVLVNSGIAPILMCVWLMFLGHRLFWHAHVGVRVLGLALLIASFQLNSNMVMALALDTVFLIRFKDQRRIRLKWFGALLVAAVSVYATMRLLAPPRQLFVEYNQLLNPAHAEDLRRIVRATAMFLTWGAIPLSALALAALAVAALRSQPTRADKTAPVEPRSIDWFAIAALVFLCLAAAFPYVMVGKGPPLFTYLGLGSSLTEQILRAAHTGPLAPTWANTSGRHGLLVAVPVALLTWLLVRTAVQGALNSGVLSTTKVFVLVLPIFLFWVLPAYKNKLDMQYAETALVKGLAQMPPAPAGVVDLRYTPASDWAIWPNVGTKILREAWGSSAYYAMFHSVDAYRDDMQWAYHTYFKNPGGFKSPAIQRSVGMDKFPGEDCQTFYEAVLPSASFWNTLWAGVDVSRVPPAQIRLISSKCTTGQVLPNPTPEKKAIL